MTPHPIEERSPAVPRQYHAPTRIIDAVCSIHGIKPIDLATRDRNPLIAEARASVAGCCRELTSASFPEIAREMGRVNHSACHHQHARWLLRPADERAEMVARVGAIVRGVTR